MAALLSVYWLWNERERLARANIADVEKFLAMAPSEQCLWGEAAIPQILAHCWYIGKRARGGAEQFLLFFLSSLLDCQISSTAQRLPSPYFSLSSVVRWRHGMGSSVEDDDIGEADFRCSSYCGRAVASCRQGQSEGRLQEDLAVVHEGHSTLFRG